MLRRRTSSLTLKIGSFFLWGAFFFNAFPLFAESLGVKTANDEKKVTEPLPRDADQPLKITADYVEFDDQKGVALYKGHVVSIQGSRQMQSDTLTILRSPNNHVEMMHATGHPARFQSQPDPAKPMGHGQANDIHYYPDEDKAILQDQAELEQNGDTITGPHLIYFFEQGLLKSKPQDSKRTTVIILPKETS